MGCGSSVNSKKLTESDLEQPQPVAQQKAPKAEDSPQPTPAKLTDISPMTTTTKVYICYYSMYGHVAALAKKQKAGVDSVPGCEGILMQVKETLPEEVTKKMYAPPQDESIPFADAHTLDQADGFLFGIPTRFGNMAGQFKTFWDSTGQLWMQGKLVGKPFGIFTSTASQGGGQEMTPLTSLSNFVHHGMIYIPTGGAFGAAMSDLENVRGGSAWGAGTFAGGDGSRKPSKTELDFAEFQGKYTAALIKKIAGK